MLRTITATLACLLLLPAAQAGDLKSQLLASDKALWTAWGKKNGSVFKKSLTADANFVLASAVPIQGRDMVANEIENNVCTREKFTIENVSLRQLAPSVAELSYDALQDGECDGTPLPNKVRVTSLYVNQNGKWLLTLHQQTAVELE